MLKGLGDVGQIMKMQKELKKIQKRLKKIEIEGESDDGSIRAVVSGEFKLMNIKIDSKLFDNADKDRIEKSIMSAVNSAIDKSKGYAEEEMAKITGGINIPGLSDFLK